ncbi:MAG TPA: DUF3341 domain-containing protein [Anaerolineae bacterium]|nr:DUF3341 domain-containing protein [Anaerolineae bacterium]
MNGSETGYELVAEFGNAQALLSAARSARDAGYPRLEAYTPFPVEGLAEALGVRDTWLPLAVIAGGILGSLGGFALQYYLSVVAYPLNVGGRPLNSWLAFLPVTYEVGSVVAVVAGFLGLLLLTRLPRAPIPLPAAIRFEDARSERFFLAVGGEPRFDVRATRRFLAELGADEVHDVPR